MPEQLVRSLSLGEEGNEQLVMSFRMEGGLHKLAKRRRKAISRNGFGFWCQRAHPSLDYRHSVAFRRYTTTLKHGVRFGATKLAQR